MLNNNFWQRIIFETVIVLIIGAIIGVLLQQFWLGIALALLLLLLFYIYQLKRLSDWIWRPNHIYPPTSYGGLNQLFYGLHKKQKRQRVKKNELLNIIQRFRHGAESIPDALLLIEEEGAITWCNKIAQTELNIHWPHDKGQNIINLLRYPEFADYIAKKDFSRPFTLLFKQQFQHPKYIEFRVISYIDEQWIVIARDIGHIYLAEKQRRDFFANASHELRTPITVIKGYLDMLQDNMIAADDIPKTLDTLQGQINRMENLIGQILTLSKIENSPLNGPLEKIDIPALLREIEHNVKQLYPDYIISFMIDDQLQVVGIKSQLDSVLINLIYNAFKHTPKGSKIAIYWKKTSHGAYFSVTDSGPGISTHHLNRLTERFYKVDDARSPNKMSTGLGLAIVKHALLNHGNTKLNIVSEIGKGSQFSFVLPIQYIVQANHKK